MIHPRYLIPFIVEDLERNKMVFIAGPRQVGKTTLARSIGDTTFAGDYLYLNWDVIDDRRAILSRKFSTNHALVIFDEIHKYRIFKNYLKGLYDDPRRTYRIIVTGSAKLDIYRRGSDSLQGRYFLYHLHPFSFAELSEKTPIIQEPKAELSFQNNGAVGHNLQDLLRFGGFPESYIGQDDTLTRRLQDAAGERLVEGDVRDIELIRDLSGMFHLTQLLPQRIGSLLSLNALREDLEIAHGTVSLWMDILERFYFHYRLSPWTAKHARSLRKEKKLYLWDWSLVPEVAARFENIVASHLLKFVSFFRDTKGYRTELHYLRDKEGHEIDFLVTINDKPWFAVEAKLSDDTPSKHLRYYQERLRIPYLYQVVSVSDVDTKYREVRVMSADKFFSGLV